MIDMDKLQKLIIISLLSTASLSWLLSTIQPDMMNVMISYNLILISLFTARLDGWDGFNDVSSYNPYGSSL